MTLRTNNPNQCTYIACAGHCDVLKGFGFLQALSICREVVGEHGTYAYYFDGLDSQVSMRMGGRACTWVGTCVGR